MAELMLGQPLFPGESGIDQLVEIIKVLGTPSREQIKTMNPNYMEHKFPQIKPHPFSKVRRCPVSCLTSFLNAGESLGVQTKDFSRGHRSGGETLGVHSWGSIKRSRGHVSPIL